MILTSCSALPLWPHKCSWGLITPANAPSWQHISKLTRTNTTTSWRTAALMMASLLMGQCNLTTFSKAHSQSSEVTAAVLVIITQDHPSIYLPALTAWITDIKTQCQIYMGGVGSKAAMLKLSKTPGSFLQLKACTKPGKDPILHPSGAHWKQTSLIKWTGVDGKAKTNPKNADDGSVGLIQPGCEPWHNILKADVERKRLYYKSISEDLYPITFIIKKDENKLYLYLS